MGVHTAARSEIALVHVRLDHVASGIVNANQSIVRAAEKLRIADCVADCIRLAIPEPTEWQRVGNYYCDWGFNGRMLMER